MGVVVNEKVALFIRDSIRRFGSKWRRTHSQLVSDPKDLFAKSPACSLPYNYRFVFLEGHDIDSLSHLVKVDCTSMVLGARVCRSGWGSNSKHIIFLVVTKGSAKFGLVIFRFKSKHYLISLNVVTIDCTWTFNLRLNSFPRSSDNQKMIFCAYSIIPKPFIVILAP